MSLDYLFKIPTQLPGPYPCCNCAKYNIQDNPSRNYCDECYEPMKFDFHQFKSGENVIDGDGLEIFFVSGDEEHFFVDSNDVDRYEEWFEKEYEKNETYNLRMYREIK